MTRHLSFWALAVACVLPQLGCVGSSQRTDTAALTGTPPNGAKQPAALPPAESARNCLVVAESMSKAGQLPAAAQQYELARQYDPGQKNISRHLAVIYDKLKIDGAARAEYDKALQESPHDANLVNDYGFFYYTRDDLQQAEQYFRKALALDAKHKCAWVNLGLTLARQGRDAESREAFEKVLRPAEAWCNLALVLTTQGKIDEARKDYEAALLLEPGLQRARQALAKMDAAAKAGPSAEAPALPGGMVH